MLIWARQWPVLGVDDDGSVCVCAAVQPMHGENKAAYYSFSSAEARRWWKGSDEVQLTAVTDSFI